MGSLKITVIIEDTTANSTLAAQHGLSCWLEAGDERILFDTGQDGTFLQNAQLLGIDVTSASRIVISHGHYDHAGGVPALLKHGSNAKFYLQHGAWDERIACPINAPPRSIGISWSETILPAGQLVKNPTTMIAPSIYCVGNISNYNGDSPNRHFQRRAGDRWVTDDFSDEQTIILVTELGLVVITGCCHCGVINTLLAAQQITGVPKIYALLGGLHLHQHSDKELLKITEGLAIFQIAQFWVNHCTGQRAYEILQASMDAEVNWAGTGSTIALPSLLTGE